MTTPAPQGVGSFQTGRSAHHQLERHWSGQKVSPHRVRLGCGHGFAEPGEPHRLLTDQKAGGTCVTCEACYAADVAGQG